MKKVLIDGGHGFWTTGNQSPDGRLIEGRYAREIALRLGEALDERGIPYHLITPEKEDTPLATRVYRANDAHKKWRDGTILLSLHSDAAGNEGWSSAKGMSVRVGLNASQNSKTLARCLYTAYEDRDLPVRKRIDDTCPWWPQNLAICRDTKMPAVLVEMFFHTNKEQVDWALSEEGKCAIVSALAEGICKFLGT